MVRLLGFLRKKQYLFIILAVISMLFQVWFDLKMPEYTNHITQIIEKSSNSSVHGNDDIKKILINGGYMLLCVIMSMIFTFMTRMVLLKVSIDHATAIRAAVYKKIQSFSKKEVDKFGTSSLIMRSTIDVNIIGNLVSDGVELTVSAIMLAVGAIKKISDSNLEWTAAIGVCIFFMFIIEIFLIRAMTKYFESQQMVNDNLNGITRENLIGLRVIRAFNASHLHQERFNDVNKKYTDINIKVGRLNLFLNPFLIFMMSVITVLIYWIGAVIIKKSGIDAAAGVFGDMVVFTTYGLMIVGSFTMASLLFMIIPRARVSAKRINEVLMTENSVQEGNGVPDKKCEGKIEFRDVSFRYQDDGENILSNITFKVDKGESVAIIGSTGCGKTTLVNLIMRFYDASEGEILIDDNNIKEYKKSELMSIIGYTSQKPEIVSGDVRENIKFGDSEADDKDIKNALEIAQCADFVDLHKEGLEKAVAQNGSNLSGGQKQRLSIARTLVKKSEIFIFDDCFSALDFRTDHEIMKKIKEKYSGRTCIIVSQRIGSVMNADRIIVLDKGRVVGIGSHNDLLETCRVYHEIAESQLGEEGLYRAKEA